MLPFFFCIPDYFLYATFLTGFRSVAAQTGMDKRRIWPLSAKRDRGPRRCTRQDVEEADEAQRSGYARIRRRSTNLMRNAG
jgi:hypothetical protein